MDKPRPSVMIGHHEQNMEPPAFVKAMHQIAEIVAAALLKMKPVTSAPVSTKEHPNISC